jgi:hypothetical protein
MRLSGWSNRRRRFAEEPHRRHVANLSVARAISVTGTRAASIAWVAVIFTRSGGSGAWVAALVLTQFATMVLFAPWAGAIGDHFDRRAVMIVSDLSSAGVFVAVAFSHSAISLVALAALSSIVGSPFGPASSAFLVMLVPEAERTRATAARASGVAIRTVLGGALGGIVVAAFGGATAFLLNAASFVVSALFVLGIRGCYRAEPSSDPAHAGIWAGVRFVARHDALRIVLAANGAALLGYGMINVGEFPLFAHLGSGAHARKARRWSGSSDSFDEAHAIAEPAGFRAGRHPQHVRVRARIWHRLLLVGLLRHQAPIGTHWSARPIRPAVSSMPPVLGTRVSAGSGRRRASGRARNRSTVVTRPEPFHARPIPQRTRPARSLRRLTPASAVNQTSSQLTSEIALDL